MQEIITPARERLVVDLHGYTTSLNGHGMEIRACGMIRSSAARFADVDGHIALVVQRVAADDTIHVQAYQF